MPVGESCASQQQTWLIGFKVHDMLITASSTTPNRNTHRHAHSTCNLLSQPQRKHHQSVLRMRHRRAVAARRTCMHCQSHLHHRQQTSLCRWVSRGTSGCRYRVFSVLNTLDARSGALLMPSRCLTTPRRLNSSMACCGTHWVVSPVHGFCLLVLLGLRLFH